VREFQILGIGRQQITDDKFRKSMREAATASSDNGFNETEME